MSKKPVKPIAKKVSKKTKTAKPAAKNQRIIHKKKSVKVSKKSSVKKGVKKPIVSAKKSPAKGAKKIQKKGVVSKPVAKPIKKPVVKKVVPSKSAAKKPAAKKPLSPKQEVKATAQKNAVEELLLRGKQRGFVTEDEIIHILPDVEQDLEGLELLYEKLENGGIRIIGSEEILKIETVKEGEKFSASEKEAAKVKARLMDMGEDEVS